MKFQNEIIDNTNRFYDADLRVFMKKHNQQCWTHNWNSQNLGKLQYLGNKWLFSYIKTTITAEDFLKKYNKKKLNFKTLVYL